MALRRPSEAHPLFLDHKTHVTSPAGLDEIMKFVLVVSVIATLFVLIGPSGPLVDTLGLPFGVILAALGTIIGAGALFFLRTDLTDAQNSVARAILGFPITSNVFLYLFLPTFLFRATPGMNLRRMLDDVVPSLVMASVVVFVATLSIGYALSLVSALPLAACLLLGAPHGTSRVPFSNPAHSVRAASIALLMASGQSSCAVPGRVIRQSMVKAESRERIIHPF